jgi:adenosylcobinamide-GDP ribazoletransferase
MNAFHDLRRAFTFLTIVPLGQLPERPPGHAFAYFPLVGLAIGGLLLLLHSLSPSELRPWVLLLAWVVITGGLHLDGLGDSCDGLLAHTSAELRLSIMKDPRAGNWAVIGLIVVLLGKLTALAHAPAWAILAAPVWGRWAMVLAALAFPYGRPGAHSLGAYFREGLGRAQWVGATAFAFLSLGLLALSGLIDPLALLGAPLALLLALGGGRWAARRLGGGLTGDVYGAICELTELVMLVVIVWLN